MGRFARAVGTAGVVAAALVACAVGPDFHRPDGPATDKYTNESAPLQTTRADNRIQRLIPGGDVYADWWKSFGTPAIDVAMEAALAGNQSLAAQRANLVSSQEALHAGYGVFLPRIDGGFSGTRQQLSLLRFGQQGAPSLFNLFTISGAVSYAIDVFGGNRRTVESLAAQVEAQHQSALATYLTVTSNVINAFIARAAYEAEIAALRESAAAAREQVTLAEAQLQGGTAPYVAVAAAKAQLAAIEAQIPGLAQRVDQANHLLAVLTGRAPAQWLAPPVALEEFTLPENMPLSLPATLVRQRPDILAAEARLHAASAEIGVTTSAMLPDLTLSGSLSNSSEAIGDLGAGGNGRNWTASAEVSAPIFRGGTLWHRRKAAVAAYRASLADYQQTVLASLQQVADTLRALEHDAESVRAQAEAERTAKDSLDITQANYEAGLVSYLSVVTAIDTYQSARIGHIGAVAQRLQDSVALYVAVGGGWWSGRDPARER